MRGGQTTPPYHSSYNTPPQQCTAGDLDTPFHGRVIYSYAYVCLLVRASVSASARACLCMAHDLLILVSCMPSPAYGTDTSGQATCSEPHRNRIYSVPVTVLTIFCRDRTGMMLGSSLRCVWRPGLRSIHPAWTSNDEAGGVHDRRCRLQAPDRCTFASRLCTLCMQCGGRKFAFRPSCISQCLCCCSL